MKAEIYFDGGARPTNPGHAGCGVLVRTEAGKEIELGRYLGIKTNNEAEYMGLIIGIKMAAGLHVREVVITGDSKTVIEQVEGNWRCNHEHLKLLRNEAQQLLDAHFDTYEFIHVRGHQGHVENERVDKLCTDAIKRGMCDRHNANPFTVRAKGQLEVVGKIVDPFA